MNLAVNVESEATIRVIEAPRAPGSLAETGLEEGMLVDLLCKTVYRQGLERSSDIARALCLPLNVVEQLIQVAKDAKLIEVLGQLGASMRAEMRYALSGKGKEWALNALSQSEYVGPAPVTIEQFAQQTDRQSIRNERLTEAMLREVLKGMILPESLYDDLGPAVNSFSAILLYGPPGNGKSTISNAVCEAFRDTIFIPQAIV
ncbi:MAG: ATPase, partial [Pseudomonadota bacterium]